MNKTKKILIAEDDISLLLPLTNQLKVEGFQVIGAIDGQDALDKSLKEHPDLILLDIVMPKMDGLTVLKTLRRDEWGKTAKIIIFTNLSDMDKVATATESGANEYVVKSDIHFPELLKKIVAILS